MRYLIYAAATCRENPGEASWAASVAGPDGSETITGTERNATANRMAIIAVVEGLRRVPEEADATVATDSRYVHSGATRWLPRRWKPNGWLGARGSAVANADLWREVDRLSSVRTVTWRLAERGDDALHDARVAARTALDAQ